MCVVCSLQGRSVRCDLVTPELAPPSLIITHGKYMETCCQWVQCASFLPDSTQFHTFMTLIIERLESPPDLGQPSMAALLKRNSLPDKEELSASWQCGVHSVPLVYTTWCHDGALLHRTLGGFMGGTGAARCAGPYTRALDTNHIHANPANSADLPPT